MKKIIIVLLFIFLVGCNNTPNYAPHIEYSKEELRVYADYEIGVNFTNHMMAMASKSIEYESYYKEYADKIDKDDFTEFKKVYDFAYTHKISYLFSQIFYYIPVAHDFDTEEKWEEYFKHWMTAIEKRDTIYINTYIEGTDVESYIKDIFKNTGDDKWDYIFVDSIVIIKDLKEVFKEQFVIYKKKIWPTLSFELHKKCENINSRLKTESFLNEWESLINYESGFDQLVFSLSKINSHSFEYIGLKDDKIVMYYNITPDITEFIEIVSHRVGYEIAKDNSSDTLRELYDDYEYLNQKYDLYDLLEELLTKTVAQFNRNIFGYDTYDYLKEFEIKDDTDNFENIIIINGVTIYGIFLDKAIAKSGQMILDSLSMSDIFFIDGKLNYKGYAYDVMDVREGIKVYYHIYAPIVISKDNEFNIITNSPDSIPELSPKGDKLLFISPFGRDVIGNIFICDLVTSNITSISTNKTSNFKMKKAIWYNENTIYLINGLNSTISQGGTLLKYSIHQKEFEHVDILLKERQEITNVVIKENKFILTIVTFDKEYIEFTYDEMIIEIED